MTAVLLLACLFASAAAIRAGVLQRGRARWAWILMGSAVALLAVNEALSLPRPTRAVSAAQTALDWASVPPSLFGLILLASRARLPAPSLRLLLDGVLVGLGLFAVSWMLFFIPAGAADQTALWAWQGPGPLALAACVLTAIAMMWAARAPRQAFASRALFAGTCVLVVLRSDLMGFWSSHSVADSWPDPLLLAAAMLCFGLAAIWVPRAELSAEPRLTVADELLPQATLLAAVLVAVLTRPDVHDSVLLYLGAALVLTLVVRQLVNLREREELFGEKALAEADSRTRTDVLRIISHEFRTPLHAILGFGQLLQSEQVPADARDSYIDQIVSSGRRLLTMIDDVLETTDLMGSAPNLELGPHDLSLAVEIAVDGVAAAAAEKRVALAVDTAPGIVAHADSRALARVVRALVENAVRFTPPDGLVTVGCSIQNGRPTVTVVDTGPGIESGHLARIFDEFTQTSAGLNRTYDGLGLGLAICRRLTIAMGGSLSVVSTPGGGSTFTVSLAPVLVDADLSSGRHGRALGAR